MVYSTKTMKKIKQKKILGCTYFLNQGDRIGQFLVFLKFNKKTSVYSVLTLPECEAILISKDELSQYLNENSIDFVEKLPKKVLNETKKEFDYRISNVEQ